jgi:TrmH family RNA methyltransferase
LKSLTIVITSRQHPLCKLVRELASRRRRAEHGLFVVPGGNAVCAALRAGWPITSVLVLADEATSAHAELARRADVPLVFVAKEIMAYLGDLPSAPDVLAVARLPIPSDAVVPTSGLTVVLGDIADPGNVGTLIRTADAVGAAAVLSTDCSADAFGPKAVRASAGSLFRMPPLPWPDRSPSAIVAAFADANVPFVVAVAHGGESCFDFRWPSRCALILGHETRGIAEAWQGAATARVTIPIMGQAESLNVATAGAVLMYAWRTHHAAAAD